MANTEQQIRWECDNEECSYIQDFASEGKCISCNTGTFRECVECKGFEESATPTDIVKLQAQEDEMKAEEDRIALEEEAKREELAKLKVKFDSGTATVSEMQKVLAAYLAEKA